MASRVRVKVNQDAIRQIEQSPEADRLIRRHAEAIASACNAESSWGGYVVEDDSEEERPARAVVIDTAVPSSDGRRDRMIRNLDAGP